ncbi:hypothetical protein K2173_011959 [Erythroxylum novogranatense]|uniref:Uncharacterized protein n=1 Tax=Erythroxylum novogranatense TaxID=1862640 RepID=A0AAV8TEF1_9ROSI|nr:hypothetical protein K2173_011959 [Erythroxylum novogranatense]
MVGPPKKHFIPLLLLLSLFALVFLSHFPFYEHSISTSSDQFFTPIDKAQKQPNSRFTFLIKVLTFNRLDSLTRCLRSLATVDYGNDTVHLHIYVDHFLQSNDSLDVLDQRLDLAHGILEFVDGFKWDFGNKVVHYRTTNLGLQGQWLESWWPGSDDEFAFVVEDDLEVSPVFYQFVRALISNYYYNVSNFSPSVYGVSLQRPRFVPGKHGNKIKLDNGTQLFLYQLVGTWGQILFPRPWKEFRLWYDIHKAKGIKPFLDGMVTTGWYKRMGERIWTPWFIKFIHSRGYFNIYTNFEHERALSVSHRDAGVNYGKNVGPDSQLIDSSYFDLSCPEKQPLSNLKWYDFCFREVHPGRVIRSLDELGSVLVSVQSQKAVFLVNLFGAPEEVIKNLLCRFEKLDIENYILLGFQSDFVFDLARRGHPVIEAEQFLSSIGAQKLLKSQNPSTKLMLSILLKAYVIDKCIEDGYDSWTLDSNMILVKNNPFHKLVHYRNDFSVGKSLDLFFARGSSSAKKVWNGFLKKLALTNDQVLLQMKSRSFVYIVDKLLNENGVEIRRIDDTTFGMKIEPKSVNKSSLEDGKKIIYWSSEIGSDLIRKRLEELGMWDLDADSSCAAVVCHHQ